jgi:hypothetical protein
MEFKSIVDTTTQTEQNLSYAANIGKYFDSSEDNSFDKLQNFPKYVPRQMLSRFIARHELFKLALNTHGHILECGVYMGGGLMTWAQLSAIYEPYNHARRVVGFDTFAGFPSVSDKDTGANQSLVQPGQLCADSYEDCMMGINLYDRNRPIGHIPRVELVKGDVASTIPQYIEDNQHLVVAMLYLDFDLYEPTKIAIESFLPRMPRGAIIAFDELCSPRWKGETIAVLETLALNKLRLQRFNFTPDLSFAVID